MLASANLQKANVSGDQRQKIILAYAQIHSSKILGSTSALDKVTTRIII